MPMLMAAMVMVMKFRGISSQPMRPRTSGTETRLGTMAIKASFIERKRKTNMTRMARNTAPRVRI